MNRVKAMLALLLAACGLSVFAQSSSPVFLLNLGGSDTPSTNTDGWKTLTINGETSESVSGDNGITCTLTLSSGKYWSLDSAATFATGTASGFIDLDCTGHNTVYEEMIASLGLTATSSDDLVNMLKKGCQSGAGGSTSTLTIGGLDQSKTYVLYIVGNAGAEGGSGYNLDTNGYSGTPVVSSVSGTTATSYTVNGTGTTKVTAAQSTPVVFRVTNLKANSSGNIVVKTMQPNGNVIALASYTPVVPAAAAMWNNDLQDDSVKGDYAMTVESTGITCTNGVVTTTVGAVAGKGAQITLPDSFGQDITVLVKYSNFSQNKGRTALFSAIWGASASAAETTLCRMGDNTMMIATQVTSSWSDSNKYSGSTYTIPTNGLMLVTMSGSALRKTEISFSTLTDSSYGAFSLAQSNSTAIYSSNIYGIKVGGTCGPTQHFWRPAMTIEEVVVFKGAYTKDSLPLSSYLAALSTTAASYSSDVSTDVNFSEISNWSPGMVAAGLQKVDSVTLNGTADDATVTFDHNLMATKLTLTSAENKNLTLKNPGRATFDSYDISGVTTGFGLDCSAANWTATNALLTTLKETSKKVTFKGSSSNGATVPFSVTGGNDSNCYNKSLTSHFVFSGGSHVFKLSNESASLTFATGATADNPTIYVKDGATLEAYLRNPSGWNASANVGGIIRIANASTLKVSYYNGTCYYAGRLYFDPGSSLIINTTGDNFRLKGGTTESTAQLYMPASDSGSSAATISSTSSSVYLQLGNGSNTGAAADIGANSTLTISAPIQSAGAYEFKKYGAGTLNITGALSMTGQITVNKGKLAVTSAGTIAAPISVEQNGALDIGGASDATMATALSGAGAVTKTGAGKLTLSNANSDFNGTITVSAGTLDIRTNRSAKLASIGDDAKLVVKQASTDTNNKIVISGTSLSAGDVKDRVMVISAADDDVEIPVESAIVADGTLTITYGVTACSATATGTTTMSALETQAMGEGGTFKAYNELTITCSDSPTITVDKDITINKLVVNGSATFKFGENTITAPSGISVSGDNAKVTIDCSSLFKGEVKILTGAIADTTKFTTSNVDDGHSVEITTSGIIAHVKDSLSRNNPVTGTATTFSHAFLGTESADWSDKSNWRTPNSDGVLKTYTGSNYPQLINAGPYDSIVFDGSLIPIANRTISMTTKMEGWNARIACCNGAKVGGAFKKLQGTSGNLWFWVDESSSLRVLSGVGNVEGGEDMSLYCAAENGIAFQQAWSLAHNFTYYLKGKGSVNFENGVSAGTHKIQQIEIQVGDSTKKAHHVAKQALVSFASGNSTPTFTLPSSDNVSCETSGVSASKKDAMVTATMDVGSYYIVQESNGVYVYVVQFADSWDADVAAASYGDINYLTVDDALAARKAAGDTGTVTLLKDYAITIEADDLVKCQDKSYTQFQLANGISVVYKNEAGATIYTQTATSAGEAVVFPGSTREENGLLPYHWYKFNNSPDSSGSVSFGTPSVGSYTDGAKGESETEKAGNTISGYSDGNSGLSLGDSDWTLSIVSKVSTTENGTLFCVGGSWSGHSVNGFAIKSLGSNNGVAVGAWTRSGDEPTTNLSLSASVADATSAFHLYTLSYEKETTTYRLFVDGVERDSIVSDFVSNNNQCYQWCGVHGDNASGFTGGGDSVIDDFRIYHQALTGRQLLTTAIAFTTAPNTWIAGSGTWSTASNWSKGTVPVAGEDVTIFADAADTTTIAMDSESEVIIGNVIFGGSGAIELVGNGTAIKAKASGTIGVFTDASVPSVCLDLNDSTMTVMSGKTLTYTTTSDKGTGVALTGAGTFKKAGAGTVWLKGTTSISNIELAKGSLDVYVNAIASGVAIKVTGGDSTTPTEIYSDTGVENYLANAQVTIAKGTTLKITTKNNDTWNVSGSAEGGSTLIACYGSDGSGFGLQNGSTLRNLTLSVPSGTGNLWIEGANILDGTVDLVVGREVKLSYANATFVVGSVSGTADINLNSGTALNITKTSTYEGSINLPVTLAADISLTLNAAKSNISAASEGYSIVTTTASGKYIYTCTSKTEPTIVVPDDVTAITNTPVQTVTYTGETAPAVTIQIPHHDGESAAFDVTKYYDQSTSGKTITFTLYTEGDNSVVPAGAAMTSATNSAGTVTGVTVTPSNVKAGFYYKLVSSTSKDSGYSGGTYQQATANDAALSLTNDVDHGDAKVIYYKVKLSETGAAD